MTARDDTISSGNIRHLGPRRSRTVLAIKTASAVILSALLIALLGGAVQADPRLTLHAFNA